MEGAIRRVATFESRDDKTSMIAGRALFERRYATDVFADGDRGLKATATIEGSRRERIEARSAEANVGRYSCRKIGPSRSDVRLDKHTRTHMANTYTALLYHVVFSTKNRERWIKPAIEERVWSYLGGIAREHDMVAQQIGGMEDHVHLVLGMRATMGVSKAVQLLKGASSKWMNDAFPALRGFAWQDGYGAFTVSKSQFGAINENSKPLFDRRYATDALAMDTVA